MRREYLGLLLTIGALLACKRVAKELIQGETAEAQQTTAPAPVVPGPTSTTTATAAAGVAASSAVAPAAPRSDPAPAESASAASASAGAPFDGTYALDAIRPIPSNCKASSVILTAVTKKAIESENFEWNFPKQVFLANRQFDYVPVLVPGSGGPNTVAFRGAEHRPTKGVALVAECNGADTCNQIAAVYKLVVPTSHPEVICGKTPTLGEDVSTHVFTDPALPSKENVVQQCVRLAACQARRDGKLDGDPAIECQRRPSNFQLRCSFKETCEAVMSCVDKARVAKAP